MVVPLTLPSPSNQFREEVGMTLPWPAHDEGPFFEVEQDLLPLFHAYPPVDDEEGDPLVAHRLRLRLPDDQFVEGEEVAMSNDVAAAVPWVYMAAAPIQLRGLVVERQQITIRGVTVVSGPPDSRVFSRYVDWAGVWAQQGVSSGRGEVGKPMFVTPNGEVIEDE
jgi:hypothetical protein